MSIRWLSIPRAISPFERHYLARANRLALVLLLLHAPVLVGLAWLNETKPLAALGLSALVLAGPVVAFFGLDNPRHVSVVDGIASMVLGGLLVHFGQGPMQVEMHFYFLVLIAALAIFGNPTVIFAAVSTVVVHHLVLWHVARGSVFTDDAPFGILLIHALFVLLAAAAASFVARTFFENVIGLERIVAERTHALEAQERDVKVILDNVEHGFCTIDEDGRLARGRSAALDAWLGAPGEAATIFDLFERRDAAFAARSRLAWDQVVADLLPPELTLAQMPCELTDGARTLRVRYKAIEHVAAGRRYLVVVADESALKAKELAELERRELVALLDRMASDRNAFFDFRDEASELVVAACHPRTKPAVRARAIHTLKGNAMLYDVETVARICEELETELQRGAPVPAASLRRLEQRWAQLNAALAPMLGGDRRCVRIPFAEHDALEAALRGGASPSAVLRALHDFRQESIRRRLEHCKAQLEHLAAQRAVDVDVTIAAADLRVEPFAWAGFWSAFVHVLRNVVSHGVESSAHRRAAGKPLANQVSLEGSLVGDDFTIAIRDDGPGIAWDAIAERARALGLPAATQADLERALFADGVSTAELVDGFAGRGVGTSALRVATEHLGGRVAVESERGRGACFRFVFPRWAMDGSPTGKYLEECGE